MSSIPRATHWGSRSRIAWTKAPFLRFWNFQRSLLLLRLFHILLWWEFRVGGLEVISFRWNFVAATDRRLLLRWSEGFIGNRKATYRGSVSISLLFVILFPFEILLLFSFPSISVFARANSTILLWNSSIHNGDKLWSFWVYSLSMHQVAKPLTIPRFYIRSHLVINL